MCFKKIGLKEGWYDIVKSLGPGGKVVQGLRSFPRSSVTLNGDMGQKCKVRVTRNEAASAGCGDAGWGGALMGSVSCRSQERELRGRA